MSESISVLKLHFTLPVAHWRIPFTQQHIHRSYPLPPPSTVLGMIHNVCGCKKGEVIPDIDMAIIGKSDYVFNQFQLFRNLGMDSTHAYKEAHPGGAMPTQVQLLGDVELFIYLKTSNTVWDIDRIEKCFKDPAAPFIIGRREDIAVLEDISILKLKTKILPFSIKEYSMWVDINTANKSGLNGVTYLLPYYYKIENEIRNFERVRSLYIEPQPVPLVNNNVEQAYIDKIKIKFDKNKNKEKYKEINIPVFFLKSDEVSNNA